MYFIYAIILLYCFSSNCFAQKNSIDTIHAVYSTKNIIFDGSPNEEIWQSVPAIGNFKQREKVNGAPASQKTEVKIIYTFEEIFIGVFCYDNQPDKIIAKAMNVDFEDEDEDAFELAVDTYLDKRNCYKFIINPLGARTDEQVTDNGNRTNRSWNGVWDTKAVINQDGWFAEIRIPFSTLKFPDKSEQIWGINFRRNLPRLLEEDLWQGWGLNFSIDNIENAGILIGINNIKKSNFAELKPYLIGGTEFNQNSTSFIKNIGLDVNYLITQALKLNVTVNTDFAQVESDVKQINLSQFQITYPEKRDFFLEGLDYFSLFIGNRVYPFYSRRIGLTDDGKPIPVIGGLRLLGKENSTTLGVLVMQTAQSDSIKSSNYSVLSLKQDLLEKSSVQFLLTNQVAGNSFKSSALTYFRYSTSNFLDSTNFTWDLALMQNFASDGFDLKSNFIRSFIALPNDEYFIAASWQRSPKEFAPTIGFQTLTNFQEYYIGAMIHPRTNKYISWLKKYDIILADVSYIINDETKALKLLEMTFSPISLDFETGDNFGFYYVKNIEKVDYTFDFFKKISIDSGLYRDTRYSLSLNSYSGRLISGNFSLRWGQLYGHFGYQYSADLNIRLIDNFQFNFYAEQTWAAMDNDYLKSMRFNSQVEYFINTKLYGSLFSQWNNEDDNIMINFRLNWIPVIGTNFYFIFNQNVSTINPKLNLSQTSIMTKLVWRFLL
ncbi:MAG: DUF5916 domain-containing protein [Candidatus Kapabacteria bacterium]|nr:DUF5916 domain-containing protein [Candidatus Kapabacteria bacterium]